jgi:hypothetical protein
MNKLTKQVLKNEARKIYDVNARKVQKRNRMTFSQFFKQYIEMRKKKQEPAPVVEEKVAEVAQALPDALEDFNFDDMVNVNKIDENSLEVQEAEVVEVVEGKIE